MRSRTGRALSTGLAATAGIATLIAVTSGRARAHVDYVRNESGEFIPLLRLIVEVLSHPVNLAFFLGGGVVVGVAVGGYLYVRPRFRDVEVLRETLDGYRDLVPWMLRLAIGLPLVGAGFSGYFFSPVVGVQSRLLQVGIGFLLLFGLATRFVAALGLLAYLVGLVFHPRLLLALEYVPGFLAIVLAGSGRPSADHMLQQVASADRTLYGRIDPIHHLAAWFHARIDPFETYIPTVLRIGVGVSFIYLGGVQKLIQSGEALVVVHRYNLEALLPITAKAWVFAAGVTEIALGIALILGLFTRGVAAVSFFMFTVTLFALANDPVLAHIPLFGLASAIFTLGAGPLAFDTRIGSVPTSHGSQASGTD
ncbi:MAG: DoxX family protein [Haloferacaceae archaeon]